jgi:hypothetical protein
MEVMFSMVSLKLQDMEHGLLITQLKDFKFPQAWKLHKASDKNSYLVNITNRDMSKRVY